MRKHDFKPVNSDLWLVYVKSVSELEYSSQLVF